MLQLTIPIPECQQTVRLPAGVLNWSEDEFFEFCQTNRELRIERSAKGEILVMSPAGGYSGYQSGEVFAQLRAWVLKDKTGFAFDSSTGFLLPNGGMRAPDAAWMQLTRLQKLSRREKEKFIPLCPDFLIEVASPSDTVSELREKMEEYLQAGLWLGWLILPTSMQVEVYTSSGVELLESPKTLLVDRVGALGILNDTGLRVLVLPKTLAGDPMLPGFRLDLASIWNPPF